MQEDAKPDGAGPGEPAHIGDLFESSLAPHGEAKPTTTPPRGAATPDELRAADERLARMSRARRLEQMRRAYDLSGAPELHRRHSKEGLRGHPSWLAARDAVLSILTREGMCALIGSPGSGKTQIGLEAIKASLLAQPDPIRPVRYELLDDIFSAINEGFGKTAKRTESQILRDYTSPVLLVVDEIDKKADSEHKRRAFYRIVDKRYRSVLPTLLIGNLADEDALRTLLDGFRVDGGAPLFDRLEERGGIVRASGWNFRWKAGVP